MSLSDVFCELSCPSCYFSIPDACRKTCCDPTLHKQSTSRLKRDQLFTLYLHVSSWHYLRVTPSLVFSKMSSFWISFPGIAYTTFTCSVSSYAPADFASAMPWTGYSADTQQTRLFCLQVTPTSTMAKLISRGLWNMRLKRECMCIKL